MRTQCGQRRPVRAEVSDPGSRNNSKLKSRLASSLPTLVSSRATPRASSPREKPPIPPRPIHRADRISGPVSPRLPLLKGRATPASPAARRGSVPCAHGRLTTSNRHSRCAVRRGLLPAAAAKGPGPPLVTRRGGRRTSFSAGRWTRVVRLVMSRLPLGSPALPFFSSLSPRTTTALTALPPSSSSSSSPPSWTRSRCRSRSTTRTWRCWGCLGRCRRAMPWSRMVTQSYISVYCVVLLNMRR